MQRWSQMRNIANEVLSGKMTGVARAKIVQKPLPDVSVAAVGGKERKERRHIWENDRNDGVKLQYPQKQCASHTRSSALKFTCLYFAVSKVAARESGMVSNRDVILLFDAASRPSLCPMRHRCREM